MPDLTYEAQAHEYRLNGVSVPSVTQVVAMAGFYAFKGIPAKALDFGSKVHRAIALADKDDLLSVHDKIKPYLEQWERFKAEVKPEWIAIEEAIYSSKLMIAGTPDRIARIGGHVGILDVKINSLNYAYAAVQTAGYALIYDKNVRRWAVELRPDGYKLEEYREPADRQAFLACLSLFNYKKLRGVK